MEYRQKIRNCEIRDRLSPYVEFMTKNTRTQIFESLRNMNFICNGMP